MIYDLWSGVNRRSAGGNTRAIPRYVEMAGKFTNIFGRLQAEKAHIQISAVGELTRVLDDPMTHILDKCPKESEHLFLRNGAPVL